VSTSTCGCGGVVEDARGKRVHTVRLSTTVAKKASSERW
jgi:hypothetical protein